MNKICLLKLPSFPDYSKEKNTLIDRIPALLQASEHVIPMFTTAQSGIWVGLLVRFLRKPGENTQETFD